MTAPTTGPALPHAAPPPPRAESDTWTLTWSGLRTVTVLELRQRIRSTRWKIALAAWFVAVGAITLLVTGSADDMVSTDGPQGPTVFGLVVFFVLFLGLLVAPTLSATAINGDRSAGTLATLQVTLLSPAEIVLGKLAASWLAALAFLAASTPFIGWAILLGGVPLLSLVTTLLLLAVMLAVVCAIGLGFSSLVSKTSGSAVLTYLTIAGLTIGSLLVFGLSLSLVTTEDTYTVRSFEGVWIDDDDWEEMNCVEETRTRDNIHSERTWWLLAINPFVIVADAAPESDRDEHGRASDPLLGIRDGVRELRRGEPARSEVVDYCRPYGEQWEEDDEDEEDVDMAPVWPWGLALNLLIGAGGVVTAVRRLRIPAERLAKGTRVA